MRAAAAAVAALVAAGALVASLVAASDDDDDRHPRVYAAASLRQALEALHAEARYSFAGSGQLQRQIEAGAPADVFAAASPEEPAALFAAGRCTRPRPFASNRLALLVGPGNPAGIRSARDLAHRGRRVALAAASVPVGRAARAALRALDVDLGGAVVSSETSAAGVVAKVALGSADAGIGYVTDARAAGSRVRGITLPAAAQPPIEYHVCAVLRPGADRAAAAAFIERLTSAAGRAALRAAGFGPPG